MANGSKLSAELFQNDTEHGPEGGLGDSEFAVLGVGNLLCRDDGAGGLVVQALEAGGLRGVTLLDAGTIGLPLLGVLQDHRAVVFIDAARMGRPPGSVGVFEGEAMDRFATAGKPSSVHEVSLATLLQAAALTGSLPDRRALIGIEPEDVSLGTEPTAAVRGAIAGACDAVATLLHRWGFDA